MKVSKSSSGILSSGGAVVASDLTVDGSTVTVDETNNRLGVNTNTPQGTIGVDGDLYLQPTASSTSHIVGTGSIDMRADANIKIGTETADSVKIGRTNTTAAKVHISSGTESDLVVSNSMVGIGTDTPTQALELDGNIQLSPSAISTAHIFTTGSLDLRASANIKIGTDGADSVKIGRVNTGAVKCHIRSGGANDLVVSNSMVGIGTDSPDHTLSVAGDIDLTGGLSFDGGTAVTSIDTDLSSVSGSHDTLVTAKAAKAYADSVAGGGTSDLTDVSGTLAVANGGTGATTLTDGGVLLGSGTGAVTATAVLANGELLIGDNSGDPTVATLTAGDGIDVTNGAGSITIAAEDSTASNKGVVIVAGGTDCTVTYSSGTATVAVDDLAASKITSGTLADARISQSSVTQHQASITGSGALNSGSITSGFGNIAIGASTFDTTGAVGTGALTAAGDIVATGGDLTLGTAADANNTTITAAAESGTNTSGKTLTIGGGLGTGTGVPGSVSITSASPTGSGTGSHTAVPVAQFASEGPTLNYGGVANLLDNEAVGEKVFFGTGQTVKGKLYYLNTSGAWALADTDAEASTAALIAVACGGDGSGSANDAATHGMLIRGFIDNASYLTGTYNEGVPVYVDGTAGNMTITRPTSGFVRVIGWCCATANVIYFNPDNTYLEL